MKKHLEGRILFQDNKISEQGEKEIFAEQHHRGLCIRYALIRDGKKMIMNQHKETGEIDMEFYNSAMNIEKENLFSGTDKQVTELFKKRILYYIQKNKNYFKKKVGRPSFKNLSQEDIEHLRSLGYIE